MDPKQKADDKPLDFFPGNTNRLGKKPTKKKRVEKDELRRRIRFVMVMISEGRAKGYVKDFLKGQYSISGRTADRYIEMARKYMLSEVEMPTKDLVANSYSYYMSVLQDKNATFKEKLKARELADKLLGLCKQSQTPQEKADKDPLETAVDEMNDEELKTIINAEKRIRELASGTGGSGQNQAR